MLPVVFQQRVKSHPGLRIGQVSDIGYESKTAVHIVIHLKNSDWPVKKWKTASVLGPVFSIPVKNHTVSSGKKPF